MKLNKRTIKLLGVSDLFSVVDKSGKFFPVERDDDPTIIEYGLVDVEVTNQIFGIRKINSTTT